MMEMVSTGARELEAPREVQGPQRAPRSPERPLDRPLPGGLIVVFGVKSEYLSGKCRVKLGNFVNFSGK